MNMNFKNIFLTAVVALTLPFAVQAKDSKKATKAAAKKEEAKKVDATGNVKWTGYGVGKSHTGDIKVSKGNLEMKGNDIVGGEFEMDMKSLTSDSEKLTVHLKSGDFFDVEKFNTAKYKITKVEALPTPAAGAPTHKFSGTLTIKDKTHPHDVMALVKKDGEKWTANADSEITDRTQYDIVYNSKKFKALSELGNKAIEDNIKVQLNLMTK